MPSITQNPPRSEFEWAQYLDNPSTILISCDMCPYSYLNERGWRRSCSPWDGYCPTTESFIAYIKRKAKTPKGNRRVY